MSDPDKTPPPDLSPEIRMLLERIDGLAEGQRVGFQMLQSDINGVVDGANKRHAETMSALASIKDTQAAHGRKLAFIEKMVKTVSNAVVKLYAEFQLFVDHVFKQFSDPPPRPSLHAVDDLIDHNGNGTHGE